MLKSVKSCAFSAKEWCNAAVFMCYLSACEIVCGENVVWKRRFHDAMRRLHAWFHVFWLKRWRIVIWKLRFELCGAVYVVEFAAVSWC